MDLSWFIGFMIVLGMLTGTCPGQLNQAMALRDADQSVQSSIAESTPEETELPAEEITENVAILVNRQNYVKTMTDNNRYTKKHIENKGTLAVESEIPFSGMYLEWDCVPGPYLLCWDGGQLECGQNGFLHEYIELPEAVTAVTFSFSEQARILLCEARVYTRGLPPEDIQVWLPPCDEADILVFPTHSDDDVLFFGPLISYYAIERQLTVQTAFMVDHRYYPIRGHERLDGLWEMGVRHYPILGTAPDTSTLDRDEAMFYYRSSNIEQWQVEQIRRFKPLVVVGHDLEGEYGNGGHKVNAHYLTLAVESAADPLAFPASEALYGVWDTPKLYLHLYPGHEIILNVDVPLTRDPQGRTPFEIAEDAFVYHGSQQMLGYRVQQKEVRCYDCRPFGLYRTLVGYDTTADIMENVSREQYRG